MNQTKMLIIHAPLDLSEAEARTVEASFHDLCIAEGVESNFTLWTNHETGFAVFPAYSRDMELDLTYRLVRSLQTIGARWF